MVKVQAQHQHSPLAKCEGAKVAVNDIQQCFCPREAQGHMTNVKILHVVARLKVLVDIALACKGNQISSGCNTS